MGFDDERTDAVEEANKFAESQRKEAALRQAETLNQMQKNREDNELVKQLAEAMGYRQQQEDIDHLKNGFAALQQSIQILVQSLQGLKTEIEKTNNVVNQQSQMLMGANQTAAGVPASSNEAKLAELTNLASTVADIWKKIKGEPAPVAGIPGFDANSLMAEAIEAVHDDFSIGKELRGAIKNSIRKKVVGNVISSVLQPDDSHGPA